MFCLTNASCSRIFECSDFRFSNGPMVGVYRKGVRLISSCVDLLDTVAILGEATCRAEMRNKIADDIKTFMTMLSIGEVVFSL